MKRGFGRAAWLVAMCVVSMVAAPGAGVGQIVITEIMQNPQAVSDNAGEWFELHNAGATAVDINGWLIEEADGNPSHAISESGGLSIAAGGYIVLAKNGTTGTNGGVTADYVYTLHFLGNSTDSLVLKNGSTEVDRVVWDNGATFPDPNGASMALKDPALDNSVGGNWCQSENAWTGSAGDKGTPGAANDCPMIPDPLTGEIYDIQTDGAESPQATGMATTNDNIVTAVGAGGFAIQTPTARSDDDVDTSDGIFVVHTGAPTVAVGDQVDVVGEVEEFFGFTRIDATVTGGAVTVDSSGNALPAPIEFGALIPSPDPAEPSCAIEYECYEGMRVNIAKGIVASGSQYFSTDNVAEMFISPTPVRPFRSPGIEYPGLDGLPIWDGNPEVFELDPDKLGLDNVSWTPGTTFTATGVIGYDFGDYELWATSLSVIDEGAALPRPVRERGAGEVTVGSLNMLNLGVSDTTQLAKLSKYVREVLGSPDILGAQEVADLAALEALAAKITADDSTVAYTANLPATSGPQRVGILTRSGVTVHSAVEYGAGETFVDPRDDSVDTLHDRPPLVVDVSVGELSMTVVVIHSRSLISVETNAFARAKRLHQAQSLARLAESMQFANVIIVGDYNAFEFSDGYVDVVGQMRGVVEPSRNLLSGPDLVSLDLCVLTTRVPSEDRYSYVFEGNAQALDHALVNQSLERHVVGMEYGRGNTEAARNNRNDATNALYSTDHDGLVVYLSPTPEAPVDRSPCQAPPAALSDLSITADSRIMDANTVRYTVRVQNAGPRAALDVKVESAVTSEAALTTSTRGCAEDPNGVPTCNLGVVDVGVEKTFVVDVTSAMASEVPVTWRGAVSSRYSDPTAGDNVVDVTTSLGPPAAPSMLVADAISETEIRLAWQDNSNVETGFGVFLQGPGDSKLREIGSVPADTATMVVKELVPSIIYNFAVEARNGDLASAKSNTASATTWTADTARCGQDDVACLGMFQIEVEWNAGDGAAGRGMAEQLTADSADFWFFHPDNIEMVIKVLDGCLYNGNHWVMGAGLTDVGVTTTVRNLTDGSTRTWTNENGTAFEPIFDTEAFACRGLETVGVGNPVSLSGFPGDLIATLYRDSLERAGLAAGQAVDGAEAACAADDGSLCLQQGRYEVRATFSTGELTGAGASLARTMDSGMFWFFSPNNVELVVKVLDGCAENGYRWVLSGGLTDVGVEITVSDSMSDAVRTYRSAEGAAFQPMIDTTAFLCSSGQ